MGLRSLAQTAGSTISLYMISPEMTGATILVLPIVIGVGTGLGSFLRATSKRAQNQVPAELSIILQIYKHPANR